MLVGAHHFAGHAHAHLLHFGRAGAPHKRHRALQRVVAQQAVQVVGQAVVDGGFHVAVKTQYALGATVGQGLVFGAVGDVVGQHLGVPGGKGFFVLEMGQCRRRVGPLVAALAADRAGRQVPHHLCVFGHGQGLGFPATEHG